MLTVTRADLADHAAAVFPELAAETGLLLADDLDQAAGISRQLDAAVRDLGTDTANRAAGEALVEYHVLRRMRYALAARVDFDATAMQGRRSQIFEHIDRLLADATDRAAAAGHPLTPASSGAQLVRLNLDYIEPAAAGGDDE